MLKTGAVGLPFRFGQTDRHHLAGIIPFIHGRGHIEPLIALQADQLAPQHAGQCLGDFGFTNPRLALQQ